MMDFILDFERKYQNKNILIVSHGYPLWILEGSAQGFNEEQIIKIKEKLY